ncbi:MAG TPA: SDR family oxidoreductase [Thermomicrobiales bacterium]|nr:SDR family oxidoreductase [Thermomicrobiales bacterium]
MSAQWEGSGRNLAGQTAIVTGASRRIGIGAAICMALARAGANVFFTHWQAYDDQMPWGADRDGPAILEEAIERQGVRASGMRVDLAEADAPARVIETATQWMGPVTILVNNAAYSTDSTWDTLDADTLDAHYQVNLRAMALLCVEFARRFPEEAQRAGSGRIINLTSGQSLGPMPGELAYAATKGAVDAFTVSLSAALAPRGITVNAVNPGPTDTGWMSDELRERLLPRFPMGRIGEPADVARLVAFLASPDARWITGQILHSEGGFIRG